MLLRFDVAIAMNVLRVVRIGFDQLAVGVCKRVRRKKLGERPLEEEALKEMYGEQ